MIFKNQISEEKLLNSIKFEKSHGNLEVKFDKNQIRFKIEDYTYGRLEFTLVEEDNLRLTNFFEPKIHKLELNTVYKELNEKENMLNKLFAYFYDQIDPITQNGSVNSKLEEIHSVDDLIDYYNKNMTVRDLKSWERKNP